jgi:membrane-associated phospholipid phosphatase
MALKALKRFIGVFRPEDWMLFLFSALLAVLLAVYGLSPIYNKGTVNRFVFAFVMLVMIGSIRLIWDLVKEKKKEPKWVLKEVLKVTRDWSPFIVLVLVYENLHDLVKVIRPEAVDDALMRIDGWIFGVQPTVWMQRISNPVLTDYMAFVYALYFLLPVSVGGILYFKKRYGDYREFMLAMVMTYYLGFLGYMTIPAIGPRYELDDVYTMKLKGIFLYDIAKDSWNSLESINRDCFPSLHTAQSALCLFFAIKYRDVLKRKWIMVAIYSPIVVSLWFSTVYLRYHWVIDVIAGMLLAIWVFLISKPMNDWWSRNVRELPRNEKDGGTKGALSEQSR